MHRLRQRTKDNTRFVQLFFEGGHYAYRVKDRIDGHAASIFCSSSGIPSLFRSLSTQDQLRLSSSARHPVFWGQKSNLSLANQLGGSRGGPSRVASS